MDPLLIIALIACAGLCGMIGFTLYSRRPAGKKSNPNKKGGMKASPTVEPMPPLIPIHQSPRPVNGEAKKAHTIPMSIPDNQGLTDSQGSLLWFIATVCAIVLPCLTLFAVGLNIVVVVVFFFTFPALSALSAYMFRKFRVCQAARELDKISKNGLVAGVHIGTDGIARFSGGRRGSTGRLHFPNMEILSDAAKKAVYPFAGSGTSLVVIKSDMDTPIIPEFVERAQLMLDHSEQIKGDGRKKDARQIMQILIDMKQEEEQLNEYDRLRKLVDTGAVVLDAYLYDRYNEILYPDGSTLEDRKSVV